MRVLLSELMKFFFAEEIECAFVHWVLGLIAVIHAAVIPQRLLSRSEYKIYSNR